MALKALLQPPINRIDLSGEWDGDPTSQVVLHAKIEFVSVPNTRLPLLDLSNDGVELLRYDGPTKRLEVDGLPHDQEEISDEKVPSGSSRGRRRGRQHPAVLKGMTNGEAEPLNETPRSLYRKGMELSPPSTKRRLFPPSPTSTTSRMPSFDDLASGLEDDSVPSRDDEYERFSSKVNRSTDVSATSISERSGAISAAQSFGTTRAVNGDPGADMEIMLSDLKDVLITTGRFGAVTTIDLRGIERENPNTIDRRNNTGRLVTSSLSSATMTPKPEKGGASKIPVKAQSLVRSASTYEELSHSLESEGNLGNTPALQPKTKSPPPEVVLVRGNETPPLMPSTPRNEQFSPVKLSNTLPADLTNHWVDHESPQSPTREPSREVGKQVSLLGRYSFPESDPRGSRRHTQIDCQITLRLPSEYVSTWLKKNECNGFAKEHSHSRFLYPPEYSTESAEARNENSPTCAESYNQNSAMPEQSESEKPITLPSPSPSSQLSMPWNSAEELARKCNSGRRSDMASPIPSPKLAIVEELNKDFYILSPETSVPTTYNIEFDFKVRLGPLQPGGWQLLKVPGLPVDRHGGNGTVKLDVLHSSTKKKLDCGTGGLLGLERNGTGFIAHFDLAEPLTVSLRAVELLTSESRDNRILNHEISMVLKHHRKVVTRAVVEYTAVCTLSLYQKILCADEGSIAVIISDGPGGDFEWAMENGNRDFRVEPKAFSASAIGTTKIRIFCKENELDGCFRITWEVPYESKVSRTWLPKLFFEKPATQAEYVPSLRSQWRAESPGGPAIQEETEPGETTLFETEEVVRKWEPDGLEDWGYLGLPELGTDSIIYWCVHQLVRVILFFMTISQELCRLIQIYLEYVPLGPMKIFLLSLAVQTMVLFNQHFGRPSIESQISQTAGPGLPCLRNYVQIEPRPGSFSWFAQEKASIIDRGVLGHIFNVVSGGGQAASSMSSENVEVAEKHLRDEGCMKNMAAHLPIVSEVGAAPPAQIGVDIEGRCDPASSSTSNLPQTKLNNNNNHNKNRRALEPTATSAGNMMPMQTSLRDRIDRFLGWKGPLE
ncbi:hypothetical protein AJ78_08096 [Emergomyces pasteurianus Ep9510]|uniref:Uncharacterized protein n=1 Tax=Emergomyces pasteurianus Ep9510 TaxID=1447872 RepID=A0A1J9Q469_9EURO|nr:hypothetical protein AJ78_08096 [Emergomyces pasteurianus Ep9510]